MIGFEWLAGLSSFVELVGSLIPRRALVSPAERGILYKGMTRIVIREPGRYWYWPFLSRFKIVSIASVPVPLPQQWVTSLGGKSYLVDATIEARLLTDEESLIKSCVEMEDVWATSVQIGMAAVCSLLSEATDQELSDRSNCTLHLTRLVRKKLRPYGLRVRIASIESLVTGKPVLLIGANKGLV